MTRESKKHFMIDLAFFLVVAVLIYIIFRFMLVYLFPFVIGVALSALVQRPAAFLSKKVRLSKGKWALALVILAYLLLIFVVGFGLYKLVIYAYGWIARLPQVATVFINWIDSLKDSINGFSDTVGISFAELPDNLIGTVASQIAGRASAYAASAASQAPGFLVSVIVTFVASCYIAMDYDKAKNYLYSILRPKYREMLNDAKTILTENIFKIAKGYLILMFINFAELTVGLLLLQVNNAVIIAALIAVLDVLPVIGTGTVLIPWALYSLINGNYILAIGLIVIYIIITIVRNILEPRIIGKQVGLHPLITLLSIFIGLRLFGVAGMISVPLAIIIIYNFYKAGKFDFLSFRAE